MGHSLSQEQIHQISIESGIDSDVVKSWYKDFIKICPNGKMDKKQFGKFYRILRGQPEDDNLSRITDHVFRSFDKDSNGYLDFSGSKNRKNLNKRNIFQFGTRRRNSDSLSLIQA